MTPYKDLQGFKRLNLLTWQPTNPVSDADLATKTRISSGGFVLVVNNTPAQTKGYAFFVDLEDFVGRKRAVLNRVWFRIEND